MALTDGEPHRLSAIDGGISEFVWRHDGRSLFAMAQLDAQGIRLLDPKPTETVSPYQKFTSDVRVITERAHKLDGVGYFGQRRGQIIRSAPP